MRIPIFVRALLTVTAALFMAVPAHSQAVSGQGTWESTLLGRDINLNPVAASDASAVYLYDTTLNVTWLRDANKNVGNGNGGLMDWNTATTWAANLVTGSGATAISDWRLPAMAANPNDGVSYDGSTSRGYNVPTNSSEMASLFYGTLGNKAYFDTSGTAQTGNGLTNAGSFQNMQSIAYWLGTEYAPVTSGAWEFVIATGFQSASMKNVQVSAMAVRTGDVLAPVPEPETYAMLLAGLGVLGAVARRRHSDKALVAQS